MKKQFISFASFSRIEKLGVFTLIVLLALLMLTRLLMRFYVHPVAGTIPDSLIQKKWAAYQEKELRHNAEADSIRAYHLTYLDKRYSNSATCPDEIDINTATAEELAKLKDIGPALARLIIKRRKSHGPFKETKELVQYCHIPLNIFQKLSPHLTITEMKKHKN